MRTFLVAVFFLGIGYAVYSYYQDPTAANHLVQSVTTAVKSQIAPPPEVPAWTPPAVIPAQPHWTWTTADGKVYHDVKIIRIDAACVTILDSEGGGRVPISTLPPDMQKYFNYDPAAAADAAHQFDAGVAEEQAAEAREGAGHPTGNYYATDDYDSAASEAKASKKLLLLHFTGSDWCPYCKQMEEELLSTAPFQSFAGGHFIVVTLDFPRGFALPDVVQTQNKRLQGTYGVSGFPTLVVTDASGHEFGRIVGMPPANEAMSELQDFVHKGELATK